MRPDQTVRKMKSSDRDRTRTSAAKSQTIARRKQRATKRAIQGR